MGDGQTAAQYYKPPYRPYSRSKTTYNGMNDWMKTQGQMMPSHVPVTLSDGNWKQVKAAVAQSAPLKSFIEPGRSDDYYKRYQQLSQNVAYRYPDPGPPRQREGAIGGTWRHIKEVLGHGGSRVVFVDGLVSLYDIDKNQLARKSMPLRASLSTPLYGASRHDSESYQKILKDDLEKQAYKPWEDKVTNCQPLPEVNTTTKSLPGSPSKYKGFYTLRK